MIFIFTCPEYFVFKSIIALVFHISTLSSNGDINPGRPRIYSCNYTCHKDDVIVGDLGFAEPAGPQECPAQPVLWALPILML